MRARIHHLSRAGVLAGLVTSVLAASSALHSGSAHAAPSPAASPVKTGSPHSTPSEQAHSKQAHSKQVTAGAFDPVATLDRLESLRWKREQNFSRAIMQIGGHHHQRALLSLPTEAGNTLFFVRYDEEGAGLTIEQAHGPLVRRSGRSEAELFAENKEYALWHLGPDFITQMDRQGDVAWVPVSGTDSFQQLRTSFPEFLEGIPSPI
jgi:hypothetical protein